MRKLIATGVVLLLAAGAHAQDIQGPVFPPPGGVTFASSGTNAGDPGGVDWTYTAFDPSAFTNLIWGPNTSLAAATMVGSGLNSILNAMSFSSISGPTASWTGTTTWANDPSGASYNTLFRATIVSGAVAWIPEGFLPPDPDITGVGAVIDNSTGVDFSVRLEFLADVGSGFQAINTIMQPSGSAGATVSSFGAAFYYVAASEPGSVLLIALGLVSLVVIRRRRAIQTAA